MSFQAVSWAMYDAPHLTTDKGKADTTARAVLAVLAEHADEYGGNAYPSPLRIRYATGYDERTIQRAITRLEDGKLIERNGIHRSGSTIWKLAIDRVRPASEWESLKAESEEERRAESASRAARRAKKSVDVSGTENPGHEPVDNPTCADTDLCVRHAECRMSGTQNAGCPARNAPRTTQGTTPGTSPGGAPPPDPRRPESPSGPRKDQQNSPLQAETPPTQAPSATTDRTREANADGFIPPPQCGYPECVRGWILPTDDRPPYQCPRCNSNVIPLFGERKAQ